MRFYMKYLIAIVLIFITLAFAQAKDSIELSRDDKNYKTELMWPEITIPWGMVMLPDGRMLATERSGTLFLLDKHKKAIKIAGLPTIHANGQGGLLDIALHPDFKKNNVLFFTFASNEGKGRGSNTALMRAKLDINKLKLTHKKILYKGEFNSYNSEHYGSRIVIADNYIYFSIGDRGARDLNPQNLSLDGGKIYRLHLDGSIPLDNPFVHQAKINSSNIKTATYSYGHRNPQGLIKFGQTGQIWSHEHGPRGGDEVNLIQAGKNYGWPVISYGINYSYTRFTDLTEKEGMEQPKLYWVPSIAPSGMAFINSVKYPSWQGKVLLGSMKFNHLILLDILDDNVIKQTKLLDDIGGRVRNVIQGSDGFIYLGVDGVGILRLLP